MIIYRIDALNILSDEDFDQILTAIDSIAVANSASNLIMEALINKNEGTASSGLKGRMEKHYLAEKEIKEDAALLKAKVIQLRRAMVAERKRQQEQRERPQPEPDMTEA